MKGQSPRCNAPFSTRIYDGIRRLRDLLVALVLKAATYLFSEFESENLEDAT